MRVIGHRSTLSPAKDLNPYFSHVPRFCYRKSFPEIQNTKLKSDRGWGCCFRCSQGVIAQFIIRLHENYSPVYNKVFGEDRNPYSLFYDSPDAPFSIQNLVKESAVFGLQPGTWAKPSIVAAAIQKIFSSEAAIHLGCIVCHDFAITKSETNICYPALLLIPGLFGIDTKLDMSFLPFLHASICIDGSLGFVSGKRNSAYFIAGIDSDNFVYFDPHTTKNAFLNADDSDSLFAIKPRCIKFNSLNPSILIGFIVEDHAALNEIMEQLMSINSSPLDIREPSDEILTRVFDIDDLNINEDV